MVYQYPKTVLPPRKVIPDIVPGTMDGGRGTPAAEQFSALDLGYWMIDLQEIPLASGPQKLAWRALSLNLQGRLGYADIPTYEDDVAPWPEFDGVPVTPDMATFSDGTIFSDGTWFDDATIIGRISVSAAAGGTQVVIDMSASPWPTQPLDGGMDFSVKGATLTRLYRISTVVAVVGDVFTVNVEPPLREAIRAGANANFEDPRCTCRLVDDQQMLSGIDDYAGRTLASLSFEEVINP